jgi:hypothetical protein
MQPEFMRDYRKWGDQFPIIGKGVHTGKPVDNQIAVSVMVIKIFYCKNMSHRLWGKSIKVMVG